MAEITYCNRRAVRVENSRVRLTVLVEGGHIAEILDKSSGVNPLWSPPWRSMEPSGYDPELHPEYGGTVESRLLAGILGHNLCLDLFGGPSAEEAAQGMPVHGEGSVLPYAMKAEGSSIEASVDLPMAGLRFERKLSLQENAVVISETVENMAASDRPVAWTQHVTLGPPFIAPGATQFRATATRSKVYEGEFAGELGYMVAGAEFDWPHVPRKGGGTVDLRVYPALAASGAYSTHLMDPAKEDAWWVAWSPESRVAVGYAWKRRDFPWLGIWEENRSRKSPPWNGETVTRGMEFGVSPMPESRRQMIDRGSLFGERGYRWIPARSRAMVTYCAFIGACDSVPEVVQWDGSSGVHFG